MIAVQLTVLLTASGITSDVRLTVCHWQQQWCDIRSYLCNGTKAEEQPICFWQQRLEKYCTHKFSKCIKRHLSKAICTCCKFCGNSSTGVSLTSFSLLSSAGSYTQQFIVQIEPMRSGQLLLENGCANSRKFCKYSAFLMCAVIRYYGINVTCRLSERSLRFL